MGNLKTMNILTERTDIARALNFGKYKVLEYNMDTEKGSSAVVLRQTRDHGVIRKECTLYCGKDTSDDGIMYLLARGALIKRHYGIMDWLESAKLANAPVINEGDEIAVFCYSEKLNVGFVRLLKAGKITPEYSTSTVFVDLELPEM